MSVQLNVRTSESIVAKIDEMVKEGAYRNRSEAVNEALRVFVSRYGEKKTEKALRETPYGAAYGLGRRDAAREALAAIMENEDMDELEKRINEIARRNIGKGNATKAVIKSHETEE
ncbi:MAG: ribbon-helix-helix domain-containing protein [Candidatus Altiarchaeia archaeon]